MARRVPGQRALPAANWARTAAWTPAVTFDVASEADIVDVLAQAVAMRTRVRVVGALHSPSDIAATDGFLIRTERYNRVLHVRAPSPHAPRPTQKSPRSRTCHDGAGIASVSRTTRSIPS